MTALPTAKAAAYLGVSRGCLALWVRDGRITPRTDGRRPVYHIRDLDRLILHRPPRGRKRRHA